MNAYAKLAIAAAAVVVVALAGIYLLPRSGGIGGPGPTPSPTPTAGPTQTASPSSSASSVAMPVGQLVAGTTYVISEDCCTGPMRLILTVPAADWETIDTVWLGKKVAGDSNNWFGTALSASQVGNVWGDQCHHTGTALEPPVGPTVSDLATALVAEAGPGAPPPTDVSLGGYVGKKVELSMPTDVKTATCESENYVRWSPADDPTGYGPVPLGDGQHDTVYILDVDGSRQVIAASYLPGTSAADLAELERLVASIRFDPRPTPSPSS